MRKRRRRYVQKMKDAEAARQSTDISKTADTDPSLDAIAELFASLSVLGRYQNPFTVCSVATPFCT
jgi:hypothetical protein